MNSFYELPDERRYALTMAAAEARRTLLLRWANMPRQETEGWDARSQAAASYLRGRASVADLGCAFMRLERYLDPGVAYVPVDVVRRDERTIVCDFNTDPIPPLNADSAACLGLLEYLYAPGDFLKALRLRLGTAVVSYCVTELTPRVEVRRGHAWVNDMDLEEIETLFHDSGWIIERGQRLDDFQHIWLLRAVPGVTAAE